MRKCGNSILGAWNSLVGGTMGPNASPPYKIMYPSHSPGDLVAPSYCGGSTVSGSFKARREHRIYFGQ